jgi:hypothetical protein
MKNIAAFRTLFDKMRLRKNFIAYFLSEFQALEKLSDYELKEFLKCGDESFFSLAFCRAPQRDDDFNEKIKRIAQYANVSPIKLSKIINRVNAVHALRQSSQAITEETYLLAAREKEKNIDDNKNTQGK